MSDPKAKTSRSPSNADHKSNMRVAIAGTGGIAWWIAHFIHEDTGHQLLWLSRSPKPHLTSAGFQMMTVNYDDRRSLEYALRGVDVVISTVPGRVQCNMVDAAIRSGVKRFAAAEFEGRPGRRAASGPTDKALDRGKSAVLQYLQTKRSQINSTVFVCGVLYERFAPGGLQQMNMGMGSAYRREGDYMVNVREMTAQVPYSNSAGQQVMLCMTGASDMAKFVVKAVDMQQPWPSELIMRGERLSCYELLTIVARVRGRSFESTSVIYHNPQSLRNLLTAPGMSAENQVKIRELIATQEGRYDYTQANLNAAFPSLVPQRFEDWLRTMWSGG